MTAPLLPDDAIDEDLQRRIGRNLLVFQRIEANLKKLMAVNRISFRIVPGMNEEEVLRSFQQAVGARTNEKNGQTLGVLVGCYVDEVLEADTSDPDPPPGGCLVSLGYQRTCPSDGKSALALQLSRIVTERNALAHNLLDHLGTGRPEQLDDARRWLDRQHALATTFLGELRDELHLLGESRLALIDHLRHADLRSMFEQAWRLQSPLADHFASEARRIARDDGWASFSSAAGTAHAGLPDELAHLKERYGHARLRPAVEATGLFEFTEESTHRGKRLLYRLREAPESQPEMAPQAPVPVP